MSKKFEVSYLPEQRELWVYSCPYKMQKEAAELRSEIEGIEPPALQQELDVVLKKIDDMKSSMEGELAQLNHLQLDYIQVIDDSLNHKKPFQYPITSVENLKRKELHFFWKMIVHSMVANNFYLLRKWCVDYPFVQKEFEVRPIRSISEQIQTFEKYLTNSKTALPASFRRLAAPYLEYLIDNLRPLEQPTTKVSESA